MVPHAAQKAEQKVSFTKFAKNVEIYMYSLCAQSSLQYRTLPQIIYTCYY